MRFHAQTAGVSLTAQQPENNIVRTAYEALAGVLGGTQSLHTNSMDETLALPSEKAVQIALRTQQVLAYETGVANTVDPLAGSYYVEATTRRFMLDWLTLHNYQAPSYIFGHHWTSGGFPYAVSAHNAARAQSRRGA